MAAGELDLRDLLSASPPVCGWDALTWIVQPRHAEPEEPNGRVTTRVWLPRWARRLRVSVSGQWEVDPDPPGLVLENHVVALVSRTPDLPTWEGGGREGAVIARAALATRFVPVVIDLGDDDPAVWVSVLTRGGADVDVSVVIGLTVEA